MAAYVIVETDITDPEGYERYKAASGPPLNLAPFDPERVVARWRAAREPGG